jgi:cell division protein FtsL
MRRLPLKEYGNPRVRRERDRASLRRQIVLLVCGLLTAGGFVVAVGQRFTAVRYGYQSEQLRAERVRLAAERERLLLELNAATSPGALEQAAKGIGMRSPQASQIGEARAVIEPRESARSVAAAAVVGAHVGIVRQH